MTRALAKGDDSMSWSVRRIRPVAPRAAPALVTATSTGLGCRPMAVARRDPTALSLDRRPRWGGRAVVACLLGAALTLPPAALRAMPKTAHEVLTQRALGKLVAPAIIAPAKPEDMVGFWMWLGRAMAFTGRGRTGEGEDAHDVELEGLRIDGERFKSRYASPRDFDLLGVRRFLGLSTARDVTVRGLVAPRTTAGELTRLGTIVRASAEPGLDGRHRARIALDDEREPRSIDGAPVPVDPAALGWSPWGAWALTAADASFGPAAGVDTLAPLWRHIEPTADAWLGGPGPRSPGLGRDHAQTCLDLGIIVTVWGGLEKSDATEYLAAEWVGAGLFYVQSAASPLRAAPLGGPALAERVPDDIDLGGAPALLAGLAWRRAMAQMLTDVFEAWLVRELDRATLGGNAHPAIADAVEARDAAAPAFDAEVRAGLEPYLKIDAAAALSKELGKEVEAAHIPEPWEDGQGAAHALIDLVADAAAGDADALVDALEGVPLPAGATPALTTDQTAAALAWLDDPAQAATREALAQVGGRLVRRAQVASYRYIQAFDRGTSDSATRRIRRRLLERMDGADARREAWVAAGAPRMPVLRASFSLGARRAADATGDPADGAPPWAWPVAGAAAALGVAVAFWRARARRT